MDCTRGGFCTCYILCPAVNCKAKYDALCSIHYNTQQAGYSYPSVLVIKVVKGPSQFLLSVFGGFRLVDAWSVVGGVPSECDV